MKSSKVLLLGLGLGILFLCGSSCKPDVKYEVIPGTLTLLVPGGIESNTSAASPCWSSDGSVIYYTYLESQTPIYWYPAPVWSVDVADSTRKKITDDEIGKIDVSRQGNLCVYYKYEGTNDLIIIMETETWTPVDTILPVEKAKHSKLGDIFEVRFSYEYSDSNRILYYLYNEHDVGTHLNKVNLDDSTDVMIVEDCSSVYFAPGPGDTLFAFTGSIVNLNTGEKRVTEIGPGYDRSLDWNPVDPGELLVAGGISEEAYVYDLDSDKIRRITGNGLTEEIWVARYSPDGKKIAVESRLFVSEGGGDWGSIWIFDPE